MDGEEGEGWKGRETGAGGSREGARGLGSGEGKRGASDVGRALRRRVERGPGRGPGAARRVPEGGASAQVAGSRPSQGRGGCGGAGEGAPRRPRGRAVPADRPVTEPRPTHSAPHGHACPRRARARLDSPSAPPPPPRPFQLRVPRLLPAAVAVVAPESRKVKPPPPGAAAARPSARAPVTARARVPARRDRESASPTSARRAARLSAPPPRARGREGAGARTAGTPAAGQGSREAVQKSEVTAESRERRRARGVPRRRCSRDPERRGKQAAGPTGGGDAGTLMGTRVKGKCWLGVGRGGLGFAPRRSRGWVLSPAAAALASHYLQSFSKWLRTNSVATLTSTQRRGVHLRPGWTTSALDSLGPRM